MTSISNIVEAYITVVRRGHHVKNRCFRHPQAYIRTVPPRRCATLTPRGSRLPSINAIHSPSSSSMKSPIPQQPTTRFPLIPAQNARGSRSPTPRTTSPQCLNCTIAAVPSREVSQPAPVTDVADALANSGIVPHAGKTDPENPLYAPKQVGYTNRLDKAVKVGSHPV